MGHDAFISYSKHDEAVAHEICAALESGGVRCWIAPRDIAGGEDYSDAIIQAINGASILLLLLSANSNASRSVRNEAEIAFTKGLLIIPVRVENVAATGGLEFFIAVRQRFDAFPPPMSRHLRRLVDTVRARLADQAAARAKPAPPVADGHAMRVDSKGVVAEQGRYERDVLKERLAR